MSTGVVARALELEPKALRAMIDSGTLPQPQWMSLGNRRERVYSLEWLMLASDQLNARRLPGLESELLQEDNLQFALRFEQDNWGVGEVARKLEAIDALWELCAETFAAETGEVAPPLKVRRLSAGSPLDLLAVVEQYGEGLLGVGGVAALFVYVLKNPDKVTGAIPRAIAAWRTGWANADEARIRQLVARADRKQFEAEASRLLKLIDSKPSKTALSGLDARSLEAVDDDAVAEIEAIAPTAADGDPAVSED
jgi:hypothetical protein